MLNASSWLSGSFQITENAREAFRDAKTCSCSITRSWGADGPQNNHPKIVKIMNFPLKFMKITISPSYGRGFWIEMDLGRDLAQNVSH